MEKRNLSPPFGNQDLHIIIPEVYNQLKQIAVHHLKSERVGHTLRPTELVHEFFLVLQREDSLIVQDRLHFIRLASTMMRHILVNYAKRRLTHKRGAGKISAGLDESVIHNSNDFTLVEFEKKQIDLIALEDSLNKLAALDERQVRIVELHFFGGLTFEEIAEVLQISIRTVQREWRFARTWLFHQLNYSQNQV